MPRSRKAERPDEPSPRPLIAAAVDPTLAALVRRERYRDAYWANTDPIARDRLLWQAQSFRHLMHLLPGESILELGSGTGWFTETLVAVSKGRNPIVAGSFAPEVRPAKTNNVEHVALTALPGALAGRRFRFIVVQNLLDRDNAAELLAAIHDLLEDGGRVVFFESNPWNAYFIARNFVLRLLQRPRTEILLNQTELYELLSEVGFVSIAARFTDFVYAPLTTRLVWLLKNLSIILENMPGVRTLAGRILVAAQKPPRITARPPVSLCRHAVLKDSVSVVVPCHNEAMNLGPLVDGLIGYYDDYMHQIVLVDDNSRDDTGAVMEELARRDRRITPVRRAPPNGVGRALADGFRATTGRYVLSMDCDFQHLLPELEDMFDALATGAEAVLGSRFSRLSVLINYPFAKIVANRAFHVAANLLFRFHRRDLTNNLKLMPGTFARGLVIEEPGFAANAEIGLKLALSGLDVREVPISWINRGFDMGRSSFRVVASGGGYLRVLTKLARETSWGRQRREEPIPPEAIESTEPIEPAKRPRSRKKQS
ncbi:MAG: glycosyltransferase [Rhodospirillales bacterium]|nr:glycosyltransferase [Rhodospirillales bacterium]